MGATCGTGNGGCAYSGVFRNSDPRAAPPRLGRRRAYSCSVDRRIFGLENEYGVTCTFRGQRRLSPDEVARYLFRRVVHWGRSSNVFLENGARLYLDVGSHPEYATPECDDVEELVAHDKAGERILEALLARCRDAPARGRHLGPGLPLQEQHRLGRELLRLPRELPRGAPRGVRPHGRRPDPVLRHPPDLVRRRQGPPWAAGRAVLHLAASRTHLGRRLIGHHALSPDHQHARRAARRRRAIQATPRDRR